MVYTPFYWYVYLLLYLFFFYYIYLLTVTRERKYIVNTRVFGVGQWWDRLRQAIESCHSQPVGMVRPLVL